MAEKPTIPDFPNLPDFGQMITQACEVVASVRGIPYDFNGTLSLENKFVVLFKTVKEMFDAQDELVKSYKALYDFVNQFFTNLNLQNEVNKKIEEMKDSGELVNLLKPTVNSEVTEWLTANITNPSNPPIDKSLTIENAAADAKIVGNKIDALTENVSKKIGNEYFFSQTKTSNYDINLYKGICSFSQTELSIGTTIILYNTDTFQKDNPENFTVWDNKIATETDPAYVIINLPKSYTHMHVWQSKSNNINLHITQIGNINESLDKINNDYGKEILQLNAGTNITSFNNLAGLTKGTAVIFVMEASARNLTIKLDTNEEYNTNSQNILTIADGVINEDKYISDVIILNDDYKSARTYNKSTVDGNKIYIYKIDFTEKENRERIISLENRVGKTNSLKNVVFDWSQYLFYANGETANVLHTDAISTPKLYDNGLYIVTFPDELTATYNVVNYKGERENITSTHPFSYFCNEFVRIYFKRKDGGELLPTSEIASKIKIMRIDRAISEYDVTISATDSNPYKKEKADIVLNGENDTEILAAIFGCYDSINAYLFNGNYNINKMYTFSDTAKISLPFNNANYDGGMGYRRYINIRGESPSTPQTLGAVNFIISESLHNSLADSGINYFIIGTPYSVENFAIARLATSCVIKNINIIGFGYNKPITYVDTTKCLSAMLDSVNVRSWQKDITKYNAFEDTPNPECCGIRVGRGSNYGIQNSVKHSNIWYCGKGIACNGEHFIFEDVKTHHNYIGFVFGDKKTVGKQEHPNIIIGCSIEGCYRLMLLSKSGVTIEQDYSSEFPKSTLIMIGTSTELRWDIPTNEIVGGITFQRTLPIKEIIKGAWRGRVEIDSDGEVFEPGSGKYFAVTKY